MKHKAWVWLCKFIGVCLGLYVGSRIGLVDVINAAKVDPVDAGAVGLGVVIFLIATCLGWLSGLLFAVLVLVLLDLRYQPSGWGHRHHPGGTAKQVQMRWERVMRGE